MKTCPNCRYDLNDDYQFCPNCGLDLTPYLDPNERPGQTDHYKIDSNYQDDTTYREDQFLPSHDSWPEDRNQTNDLSKDHRHTHYTPEKRNLIRLGLINILLFAASGLTILGIILPNFLDLSILSEALTSLSSFGLPIQSVSNLLDQSSSLQKLLMNYSRFAETYQTFQGLLGSGAGINLPDLPYLRHLAQVLLLMPILNLPLSIFQFNWARKLNVLFSLVALGLTGGMVYYAWPYLNDYQIPWGPTAYLYGAGLLAMTLFSLIRWLARK